MLSRTRRAPIAVLLTALALGLAACGDDDNEQEAAQTPAATETATAEATETPGEAAAEATDNTDLETKPTVTVPEGDPPAELETEDIVKGKGKTAKEGDNVTVQYVGVSYSTGQQFDASWDSGQPFEFQLGVGQVIPGWDQGVAGMKEGGRRQLVIPPDLGYGEQGSPPAIAPNETLIFIVDLLEVQ
jgi:peptidylprolyl isomerase